MIVQKKTKSILHAGLVPGASVEKDVAMHPVHQVAQLRAENYRLVATDMRQCETFLQDLHQAGFNGMANTLFLSECVLVYLQPEFGDAIISALNGMCLNPAALSEIVVGWVLS